MSSSESTTVPSASFDDIDVEAFDAFLREHAPRLAADEIPREDAMVQLRVAAAMGSRIVPTVAGIYLFGRNPQWLLPQLGMIGVRISGYDISDQVVERRDFEGPLSDLVDQAIAFVDDVGRRIVNQIDPSESTPEFPLAAVHEAVVNALVHRDLRAGGVPAIRLFEDRLEVWNPGNAGGLPHDLSHYVRSGGVSLTRNPLVAVLARKLGYAEQLGRGLPTMREVVAREIQGEIDVSSSKEGVLVKIPSGLHAHETSVPDARN